MNSRIFVGKIMHARLEPVMHRFTYPIYVYALDLDELDRLDRQLICFGHNKLRPVSIHDKDYLKGEGTIGAKLRQFLKAQGCQDEVSRIELVTSARYFNTVFNPVNFYYCYRPDGSLRCTVAEVNNTFKETHLYILDTSDRPLPGELAHYRATKEFHVSPFNDMQGHYEFSFSDIRERLDIRIDLVRQGRKWILSRIWGDPVPLTSWNLFRTLLHYPVTAALTMPRIMWQAARLSMKRLPVYTKPNPSSPMTIRTAPPTWRQKWSQAYILPFMARLKKGCLKVILPDHSVRVFGDPESDLRATLQINDPAFFWRCLAGGDIGFGESYMAGEWDTDDLPGLLRIFIENQDNISDRHIKLAWLGRRLNHFRHWLRSNTLTRSRLNIQAHYDLSNKFFQTFLDPSMTYSSALFLDPEESLEEGQRNKLQAVIRKAGLSAGEHILEIGSGWGSFAIEAARSTGCRVTSITLSNEQLVLARERARQAGLEGQVAFELCDYRHVSGQYDKIVSIEMLEAVGHEYLGTFFNVCDRLLKPDGLLVLQVITIPDQRYDAYRKGSDWIQKYIFPGGMLPSLTAICQAMTRHSRFILQNLENIGIHYARTLRLWRERFCAAGTELDSLGLDERDRRMWTYYFAYCEAGFATRTLGDLQLVLTRPNNKRIDAYKEPRHELWSTSHER